MGEDKAVPTSDEPTQASEAVVAIAERAASPGSTATRISDLIDPSSPKTQLRDEHHKWFNILFNTYGVVVIGALVFQLLLGDLLFALYEWWGAKWNLSAPVIDAWLGATVVQVTGIVIVVTKHLFPEGKDNPNS